jgi:hypothetical protein
MNNNNTLIQAYENWIHDNIAMGYRGYFLTFMFSPLQGCDQTKLLEMKKRLGWFYGRLAKASVPKARDKKWTSFLPKAVLAPDFPVFKHAKQQLRDVTINNGLHWHGLVLTHPFAPKIQEPLDVHIKGNLAKYLVKGIRKIDIKPITHDAEYVTDYGMKSVKNRLLGDEIVLFPRAVSELPSTILGSPDEPLKAPPERPTYDFQRN